MEFETGDGARTGTDITTFSGGAIKADVVRGSCSFRGWNAEGAYFDLSLRCLCC